MLLIVMQMNILMLNGWTLEFMDVIDFSGISTYNYVHVYTCMYVIMYVHAEPVLSVDEATLQIPALSTCDFAYHNHHVLHSSLSITS